MMEILRNVLLIGNLVVAAYFILINGSYLLLIGLAAWDSVMARRRSAFAAYEEAYSAPAAPSIAVIVPAHNEEAGITESISAMLALRYPAIEVVVVDDGSTDDTFERLREKYDLVAVPRVFPDEIPVREPAQSVHVPRTSPVPLTVVRKRNSGRADALNVGINLARSSLICMVDADSILDPTALLSVVKPFLDDPVRQAATGGVVRIANGCQVVAGQILDVRMPGGWLPRIQVVEYLRAFLLGRVGWSRLGGLLVISGAFGLFRRDLMVELGGLDPATIGEDSEIVVRFHRELRTRRRDYRISFVSEPVSWTEVPSTWKVLAAQRRRWHRGLCEILGKHRSMLLNPRYGRVGLMAMPYYLLFEFFAPIIELGGLLLLPLALFLHAINWIFALALLLVAYGFSVVVALVALVAEEFLFHRYRRWSDLRWAVLASILENVGYRQLTCLWRLQGLWSAVRGKRQVWGTMSREGFSGVKT